MSQLFRTLILLPVFERDIGLTLQIHFCDNTYQRYYFLFVYLEWIKTAFTHFSPLSLSIVLTQLNRWCANLFDMIVCNGHISSFMINPNGLYPHVPSHATEFELALALIFKTGSTLLVHHWQPGGLYMTGTVNTNHPLSAVQFVFLAG